MNEESKPDEPELVECVGCGEVVESGILDSDNLCPGCADYYDEQDETDDPET